MSWREQKCPKFEAVANGDSNFGSLDCEFGILPLSYRAPMLFVRVNWLKTVQNVSSLAVLLYRQRRTLPHCGITSILVFTLTHYILTVVLHVSRCRLLQLWPDCWRKIPFQSVTQSSLTTRGTEQRRTTSTYWLSVNS